MKRILIMTFFCLSTRALELSDLTIEYKKSIGTNRHWIIPNGETKQGEVNFIMRQDGEYVFTSGKIHTMFTDRQFRYGALEGEIGFKYENIEVFLHHKSEHSLDGVYQGVEKYPNQNSVGVRIKLD